MAHEPTTTAAAVVSEFTDITAPSISLGADLNSLPSRYGNFKITAQALQNQKQNLRKPGFEDEPGSDAEDDDAVGDLEERIKGNHVGSEQENTKTTINWNIISSDGTIAIPSQHQLINDLFDKHPNLVIQSVHGTRKKQLVIEQLYRILTIKPDTKCLWISPDATCLHKSAEICEEHAIRYKLSNALRIRQPNQAENENVSVDQCKEDTDKHIESSSIEEDDEENCLAAGLEYIAAEPPNVSFVLVSDVETLLATTPQEKFDIIVFDLIDRIITETREVQGDVDRFSKMCSHVQQLSRKDEHSKVWAFDYYVRHETILETMYQLTGNRFHHLVNSKPAIMRLMNYRASSHHKVDFTLSGWYTWLKVKLKEGKTVTILMDEPHRQGKYLTAKNILAPIKPKYRGQIKVKQLGLLDVNYQTEPADFLFVLGSRLVDWKRFEQEARRFTAIRDANIYLGFMAKR